MRNYPLTIIPNDDGTYTVLSNIFNIVTEWNTIDEAVFNWKEAIECHLEWLARNSYEYNLHKSMTNAFNITVNV